MTIKLKIDLSDGTNGGGTEGDPSSADDVLATIDFSDWHFYPQQDDDFNQALENVVRKVAAEAVRNVLRDEPPTIEFTSDGASVTVVINFGSNWNDGHIWFIASIEEMIDDLIVHSHRDMMDGGDDTKTELADCLLRCASKLKAAAGGA